MASNLCIRDHKVAIYKFECFADLRPSGFWICHCNWDFQLKQQLTRAKKFPTVCTREVVSDSCLEQLSTYMAILAGSD